MTELKTLKDLKDKLANIIVEQRTFIPDSEFVEIKELKQEAIKWVKQSILEDIERNLKVHEMLRRTPGHEVRLMMEFFNLTSENLK